MLGILLSYILTLALCIAHRARLAAAGAWGRPDLEGWQPPRPPLISNRPSVLWAVDAQARLIVRCEGLYRREAQALGRGGGIDLRADRLR